MRTMDPNKTAPQVIDPTVWLITGVLIGSCFHAPTAIALIFVWLIIRNNPLPEIIGGKHPQDIIVDLVNMGWLLSLRIFSDKYRTSGSSISSMLSRTASSPTAMKVEPLPDTEMVTRRVVRPTTRIKRA